MAREVSAPGSNLHVVVKLDVGAVVRLLAGSSVKRGYIGAMPTFTLAGIEYDLNAKHPCELALKAERQAMTQGPTRTQEAIDGK